jgi:hypothetical protein
MRCAPSMLAVRLLEGLEGRIAEGIIKVKVQK